MKGKKWLLGIIPIYLFVLFTTNSLVGCSKTDTVHDTTVKIVRDTTLETTYVHPPLDTVIMHINDSLWAYFPLNTTLADSSGHNHVLSLFGGAGFTDDMFGRPSSALNFNGSTAYGSIPDDSRFRPDSFSVSLFVMPRATSGLFLGKQDYATANGATFNVGFDNVNYGSFARFSVTNFQSSICSQAPNGAHVSQDSLDIFKTYDWYHIVITYAKNQMKFYVNDRLVSSQNISESVNDCQNAQFILGNWWAGGTNAFDGKIDNIRIYTRAISHAEIDYLFDQFNR